MLVNDVRIIPVVNSEVIASAPKTTMTSWPNINPRMDSTGTSIRARACAVSCEVLPQANRVEKPTLTAIVATSVQKVERTVRILVHSERRAPRKSARTGVAGRVAEVRRAGAGARVVEDIASDSD